MQKAIKEAAKRNDIATCKVSCLLPQRPTWPNRAPFPPGSHDTGNALSCTAWPCCLLNNCTDAGQGGGAFTQGGGAAVRQ